MPGEVTIDVSVGEPKPNPLFDEELLALTKFLTYTKPIKCAHCGKARRRHWTQLKFFRVMDEAAFRLKASAVIYPPLTPVCTSHILKPEID